MSDTQITSVVVGKPAPFKVPDREGCLLEIGYPTTGMNVLVQYPNLNMLELNAFKSKLAGYSYYESETIIPIAYWIFQFGNNTFIETTFNACFAVDKPEYMGAIQYFMSEMRNAVTFFILDGQIVKSVRIIGLHIEAVELFHNTIKKQLLNTYSNNEYMLTLKQMECAVSTKDIYHMGRQFKF